MRSRNPTGNHDVSIFVHQAFKQNGHGHLFNPRKSTGPHNVLTNPFKGLSTNAPKA